MYFVFLVFIVRWFGGWIGFFMWDFMWEEEKVEGGRDYGVVKCLVDLDLKVF